MSLRLSVLVPIVIASTVLAADLSEKWSKRLESADAVYQQAIQKADNTRFYAVQKATQDRVKLLKTALTDATKAGDFEAATEIKSRLAAAETAGGVRPKPKNTVKFGGHEYALIEEKATWHVAKRRCEEMGGHLAVIETPAENDGLLAMCKAGGFSAWLGATDEVTEDKWVWLTGKPVGISFHHDNSYESEHYLVFWPPSGGWDDNGSARHGFLCEWDN